VIPALVFAVTLFATQIGLFAWTRNRLLRLIGTCVALVLAFFAVALVMSWMGVMPRGGVLGKILIPISISALLLCARRPKVQASADIESAAQFVRHGRSGSRAISSLPEVFKRIEEAEGVLARVRQRHQGLPATGSDSAAAVFRAAEEDAERECRAGALELENLVSSSIADTGRASAECDAIAWQSLAQGSSTFADAQLRQGTYRRYLDSRRAALRGELDALVEAVGKAAKARSEMESLRSLDADQLGSGVDVMASLPRAAAIELIKRPDSIEELRKRASATLLQADDRAKLLLKKMLASGSRVVPVLVDDALSQFVDSDMQETTRESRSRAVASASGRAPAVVTREPPIAPTTISHPRPPSASGAQWPGGVEGPTTTENPRSQSSSGRGRSRYDRKLSLDENDSSPFAFIIFAGVVAAVFLATCTGGAGK
jgi:hypothetical protein